MMFRSFGNRPDGRVVWSLLLIAVAPAAAAPILGSSPWTAPAHYGPRALLPTAHGAMRRCRRHYRWRPTGVHAPRRLCGRPGCRIPPPHAFVHPFAGVAIRVMRSRRLARRLAESGRWSSPWTAARTLSPVSRGARRWWPCTAVRPPAAFVPPPAWAPHPSSRAEIWPTLPSRGRATSAGAVVGQPMNPPGPTAGSSTAFAGRAVPAGSQPWLGPWLGQAAGGPRDASSATAVAQAGSRIRARRRCRRHGRLPVQLASDNNERVA